MYKIGSYRNALVASYTWPKLGKDYYPFGSSLPMRSWSDVSRVYRYGFNGKEKDSEGMGGGNSTYDYGFRIYNTNLGKFLSVDPLFKSYPWYTPFQFAGNKPINSIDVDGLEEQCVNSNTNSSDPNNCAQESSDQTNLNSNGNDCSSQNLTAMNSTNNNATECAMDNSSIQPGSVIDGKVVVASGPTTTVTSTSHTFAYDEGYTGVAVGNDIIYTTITQTQFVSYSDGTTGQINTFITYKAIINENGQLEGGVAMSYSSNVGGGVDANGQPKEFKLNAIVDLTATPSDFKSVYNAAYNYKNAKETKQTSFIQTIAWNNRQKMDLTKSVVDGVSEGLSYIGKYGEIASKIIGVGYSLYEINTKETNSDNPLDIRIVITKSNVQ